MSSFWIERTSVSVHASAPMASGGNVLAVDAPRDRSLARHHAGDGGVADRALEQKDAAGCERLRAGSQRLDPGALGCRDGLLGGGRGGVLGRP